MLVPPGEWNAIFHNLDTWIYGISNIFDDVSTCWVKYGILFIKVHYRHSKNNTISYPYPNYNRATWPYPKASRNANLNLYPNLERKL